VDHPVRSLQPSQWRSAALVAAAIAALELALLVVAAVAIFAEPFADSVEKAAATEVAEARQAPAADRPKATAKAPPLPRQKIPAAELPRTKTSVLVLNGNGRTGAAGEAASVVQSLNYLVASTGDAPRTDFQRSIVMYRPGYKGEAYRLAKDVRVKQVSPLDGLRPGDLSGAHVVLIVGG
jgi:hypothetical protein